MNDARATAERWPPAAVALRALERYVLTEAEQRYVEEQLALVVETVQARQISGHFADWLIKQIAEETAEVVAARVRLGG